MEEEHGTVAVRLRVTGSEVIDRGDSRDTTGRVPVLPLAAQPQSQSLIATNTEHGHVART